MTAAVKSRRFHNGAWLYREATNPTATSPITVTPTPPLTPNNAGKLTGICGVDAIAIGTSKVPKKLPRQNNGSATKAITFPEPALISVPDPQPKIICMERPNTKAAITIVTDTGAIAPKNDPGASAIMG